jgi:hypothetical protein
VSPLFRLLLRDLIKADTMGGSCSRHGTEYNAPFFLKLSREMATRRIWGRQKDGIKIFLREIELSIMDLKIESSSGPLLRLP